LHNVYLLDYLHRYYPKRFVVSLYIYEKNKKVKNSIQIYIKGGPWRYIKRFYVTRWVSDRWGLYKLYTFTI